MKNRFLISDYVCDVRKGIWSRPGYDGIRYSDGDESESRIARIIDQASDITVFSPELQKHCTDWPSRYHLASARANILRPFATALTGDILEIGAGCGAITRYLGESGANILALEGTLRRAAIARSRTRDLENVMVLAERFDHFQSDCKFDVITLIGVLEYANLFTTGEHPALAMLQRIRSLLKLEGKLIVAIENQLGMKYFAGAPEDHLGLPMYGVEGRYRPDQPQTFGRAVLADLLAEAGFATVEFMAPFPDYKLPVSILTVEGFSNKQFDGAALAWQSVRRDPQLPTSTNFSLELAWPEVFKNGLGLDMANSFLVAASPLRQRLVKRGILGYHYSTDRAPRYCKEAIFEQLDDSEVTVDYCRLAGLAGDIESNKIITFRWPERTVYMEGQPLSLAFAKIVTRERWTIDEVGAFIQRYINLLIVIADQKGHPVGNLRLSDRLPGDFFDVTPKNIIVDPTGQPAVIAIEWFMKSDIEVGFLLFRSLLSGIGMVGFDGNSAGDNFSRRTFIKLALAAGGYSLTNDDIQRFSELESLIQQQVTGRSSPELLNWLEQPLQTASQKVTKHAEQAARLNHAIAERDGRIADLQRQIADVHTSTSWRLTRPVRAIKSALAAVGKHANRED